MEHYYWTKKTSDEEKKADPQKSVQVKCLPYATNYLDLVVKEKKYFCLTKLEQIRGNNIDLKKRIYIKYPKLNGIQLYNKEPMVNRHEKAKKYI
mmetsp:Transcript_12309/g.18378  ORF Transcript_12309/g.18378 Transcript_12309/m.18378 type:complete len:94 (-) Transcript_12309:519-800(-)